MISLFETDEFAQYPVVVRMLTPRETFDKTLLNFIEYRHYYYGSPFYFSSALLLLPAKLADDLQNTQLNLLLLRQVISVLPMIAALLIFTYLHTKFQSRWKSIALFILLLFVPAVVENNMWWHVDSLAIFFIALTFLFLDLDNLSFGRFYYLAAVSTGVATATKVIGLFFFLTIPTYLLIGLIRKKLLWKGVFFHALGFVSLMAGAIVISNPFLLLPGERTRMADLLTRQFGSMSAGWVLTYDKGPASWLPVLQSLYGSLPFLCLALFVLGVGIYHAKTRLRHLLIASWAVPFGLYVLFTIAIKPTHFFLPILLPVFSCLVVLTDFSLLKPASKLSTGDSEVGKAGGHSSSKTVRWVWCTLIIAILGYQFASYLNKDIQLYVDVRKREQNEKSLVFYRILERAYLPQIQSAEQLVVFRDVRMYFPEDPRWIVRTYWNSNYTTIEKIRPDLIILWAQRILDYTQQGAQEKAVNPGRFQDTYQFYIDADTDQLRGYRLVFRNEEGLFFVREAIYEGYFE